MMSSDRLEDSDRIMDLKRLSNHLEHLTRPGQFPRAAGGTSRTVYHHPWPLFSRRREGVCEHLRRHGPGGGGPYGWERAGLRCADDVDAQLGIVRHGYL